jgi:hypothetical protein
LWLPDLQRQAVAQTDWLWQGFLAAGNLTLLTGSAKSGKTTLLALLLARMKAGGELAGLAVRPGKAVVVSEEPPSHWLKRSERFDFAGHVCWFCRPFRGLPGPAEWQALLENIERIHAQTPLSLLAIDPLAGLLPMHSENDAGTLLAALQPLERLTAAGLAVLLSHHPRKKVASVGQAARGTSALIGHADVLLEMHWHEPADPADRRRRLLAWSRHEETPRQCLIELSADGRDYAALAEIEETPDVLTRDVLWQVLAQARLKRTLPELLADWPEGFPKPCAMTVYRLLDAAVKRGELKRDGAGVKNDPFRYWLPSLEERQKADPVAQLEQTIADSRRAVQNGSLFRSGPNG